MRGREHRVKRACAIARAAKKNNVARSNRRKLDMHRSDDGVAVCRRVASRCVAWPFSPSQLPFRLGMRERRLLVHASYTPCKVLGGLHGLARGWESGARGARFCSLSTRSRSEDA